MKPKKSDFLEKEILVTMTEDAIQRQKHGLGGGHYNLTGFIPGDSYKTVGLTYETFDDGSRALCWMLFNHEGVLVTKSTELFKAVLGELA